MSNRQFGPALTRGVWAGAVGAVVMIPFGAAIGAAGFRVNVYGELVAELVFGTTARPVLFLLHMLIGVAAALPLVLVLQRTRQSPLWVGAAYGFAFWLAGNSLLLPLLFGHPLPWSVGASALWPSMVVHVVYGFAAGAVWRALNRSANQR